MIRKLIFLSMLLFGTIDSDAAIWRVERDGSGDFTTLQPAADAAASGDTILVGPGRYNELAAYTCPEPRFDVRLSVAQAELTIIGAGNDQTIIGQEIPWDVEQGVQMGIAAVGAPYCTNESLYLRGLRFENMYHAVHPEYSYRIDIRDCTFDDNNFAIITDCYVINIDHCEFSAARQWASFLDQFAAADTLTLTNCRSSQGASSTHHFAFGSSRYAEVRNCRFDGGGTGLLVAGAGSGIINCCFSGQDQAIYMSSFLYGTIDVVDCEITNTGIGIMQDTSGSLRVERTKFENITRACYTHYGPPLGFIRDCILDKGEQYVLKATYHSPSPGSVADPKEMVSFSPEPRYRLEDAAERPVTVLSEMDIYFDATDNWWGTTDPDSIQAWIQDGNDLPDWPYYFLWEPFKMEPLSDQKSSLGGMKALFR